jgi:hypothetical protein
MERYMKSNAAGSKSNTQDKKKTQPIAGSKKDDRNYFYEFEISLKDIEPPIWRRILVPSIISFYKLHKILQVTMGWNNCHLYEFHVAGLLLGDPDPEAPDTRNARRYKLRQVLAENETDFLYIYDFGDNWVHKILLKRIYVMDIYPMISSCSYGQRACPPEDCGGPWGYADLLKIISDPKHKDYKSMITWLGGKIDPEHFDLRQVNLKLASLRL